MTSLLTVLLAPALAGTTATYDADTREVLYITGTRFGVSAAYTGGDDVVLSKEMRTGNVRIGAANFLVHQDRIFPNGNVNFAEHSAGVVFTETGPGLRLGTMAGTDIPSALMTFNVGGGVALEGTTDLHDADRYSAFVEVNGTFGTGDIRSHIHVALEPVVGIGIRKDDTGTPAVAVRYGARFTMKYLF